MKPLVGISCCTKEFGVFGMPNHAASDTYVRATDLVVGGVPVLLPANGPTADIETLLDRLDGIILTGSRSNVQPTLYDGPPHAAGTWEDPARDGITLPLIRAAVARGVPPARHLPRLPGTQRRPRRIAPPEVAGLAGPAGSFKRRCNPSPKVRQGKSHTIRVTSDGWLHALAGATEIAVNSLHNQGIDRLAPGLVAEGVAPDGTIEAVRVVSSQAGPVRGFAVGVQWHPEYDWTTDAVSRRIFAQFGEKVRAYVREARQGPMAAAAD